MLDLVAITGGLRGGRQGRWLHSPQSTSQALQIGPGGHSIRLMVSQALVVRHTIIPRCCVSLVIVSMLWNMTTASITSRSNIWSILTHVSYDLVFLVFEWVSDKWLFVIDWLTWPDPTQPQPYIDFYLFSPIAISVLHPSQLPGHEAGGCGWSDADSGWQRSDQFPATNTWCFTAGWWQQTHKKWVFTHIFFLLILLQLMFGECCWILVCLSEN